MILYAESSAVLAWLLGETRGRDVADAMASAESIVASELTLVECERVLIRAWNSGLITEGERGDQSAHLARAAGHWTRLRVDDEVVERTRRPFPVEPIRTLDALHLASALVARSAVPGVRLLSLDQRVRENGERLGFDLLP
ncbi:MAG: PIN domain-containing protein [Gemmatimonadetes bacterium]|nr:type II toxin-antitoxin system VapC family toxin [Gemmatimonadota bacterium]NIR81335.1 type II toxin-antitoxin system VapC family toxin [Gemmatimonadota bacterium]NIT88750.1 type II toxin-antitoxin system VapC family toxin [Gemmatimonadota bacterium]NIU30793.1 type II toxin-antitoxin system VapC family toxin [Gemmatimonadota bacterium]NIU35579.1 PIN domain-containing protein [Gemmatimonadota bacterium]